jgi:hypothetical protein
VKEVQDHLTRSGVRDRSPGPSLKGVTSGNSQPRAAVSIVVRMFGSSHQVSLLKVGVARRSDFEDLVPNGEKGVVCF